MPRGRPRNAPPAHVEFSPADLRRFSQAMLDMGRELKRDLPRVTQQAAVWFCQSARKVTPISQRLRDVEGPIAEKDVPYQKHWMVRKEWWKYNILKYNKNSEIVKIPTPVKDDKRRLIVFRGAARNAWGGCIGKLFKSPQLVGNKGGEIAQKYSETVIGNTGGSAFVEVANKVKYIEKLDRGSSTNPPHHIMARAFLSTTKRMDGLIHKAWKKQAQKFNNF